MPVTLFSRNKTLLTDTGDVCHQKVASLWHYGLKPCSPQTRGQLVPFLLQNCGQLLEVALLTSEQLVFSLKALSYSFLLDTVEKTIFFSML